MDNKRQCQYKGCKIHPKTGDFCSKHAYRSNMVQCEFIKADSTRCTNISCKNLCRSHCFDRTPNQCKYIGVKNGPCANKCKKDFCHVHNPKSIKTRVETTRKITNSKYHEGKAKKELLDSIIIDLDKLELPEELKLKLKQLNQ